jgi:Tol biopolymer transport system component
VTLKEAGDVDHYVSVRLSPDASNIVVTRMDSDSGLADLWLVDPVRKMRTRLTFDDGVDTSPVWSPRSDQILFASSPQATLAVYRKTLDAGSEPVLVSKSANHLRPTDWSRDGQWIVYEERHPQTRLDIWMMPAAGGGSPKPLARSPFNEYQGQLSPDGKWLTYTSDDSGRAEVFLRAVEETGTPYRVSVAGGFMPRWRDDGKELFYVSLDGRLNATPVTLNGSGKVSTGTPTALFDFPAPGPGVSDYRYDVGPKGDQFVVIVPEAAEAREFFSVTVNWRRNIR